MSGVEYKWKVLTVTTLSVFMVTLDSSVIVVGLPTVVEDLKTSLFLGTWIITSYRLAITVLLIAIGRFTDIFGRVKLYNTGFAMFALGSALCAISPNAELLLAFRIIQGIGGAFLIGNGISIVTDSFPERELGKAIGINFTAANAGNIVGYTLSGVMIGLFGWRSIFWLNLPIGILGTLWCHLRLKELYKRIESERFDYVGAVAFSTGILMLLIALTGDIGSSLIRGLYVGSALLLASFVFLERRAKHPIFDPMIFRIRKFSTGIAASLLNSLSFASLSFVLTLYLQLVRGFSALDAGIILIPLDLTIILVGPASGYLSDRHGARGLTAIGLGVMGIVLLIFANFSLSTSLVLVAVTLTLAGIGRGLFLSPNASSIMGSVPLERHGIANGVRTMVNNASNAVSIPLAMALMTVILPYDRLATVVTATLIAHEEIPSLLAAMSYAFYGLFILNAAAVVASVLRGR
jgi:EmrB/QacA subfamily drug resistance transporter